MGGPSLFSDLGLFVQEEVPKLRDIISNFKEILTRVTGIVKRFNGRKGFCFI